MNVALHNLDAATAGRLFGAATRHASTLLERIPGARLLWLNRRVMREDPAWTSTGADEAAYRRHLLSACAWQVAREPGGTDVRVGFADRYGGEGIGHNGGSARAVVLGGYHVKGVGQTPLLGRGTNREHATGGAYLEECVRESIFAEIAAAEFPHGAIPTLAIIDTGMTQAWATEHGPKVERRCLLVRPNFVRPAHFERAADFRSGQVKEGVRDAQRVRATVHEAAQVWADGALGVHYRQFWARWSEQLAYGFAHRLPHFAQTTSNVCLGGQLLDFGAMAAVPSWARVDAVLGGAPAGSEFESLSRCLLGQLPQMARHLDPTLGQPDIQADLLGAVTRTYAHTLRVQMLRVLGLTRDVATRALASNDGIALSHELLRLVRHCQRERFATYAGTPAIDASWEAAAFWHDAPPVPMDKLRKLVDGALEDSAAGDAIGLARARSSLRARGRSALYRESIRRSIYDALERVPHDDASLASAVEALIRREVVTNRRDGAHEMAGCRPLGFAQGGDVAFSLHEHPATGRRWAVPEWPVAPDGAGARAAASLEIRHLGEGELAFVDPAQPCVEATLALHPA